MFLILLVLKSFQRFHIDIQRKIDRNAVLGRQDILRTIYTYL